jgi:hypothetical protein
MRMIHAMKPAFLFPLVPVMRCLCASLLLLLTGCVVKRGHEYPGGLAAFAPRMGSAANYTYHPRYEAYYHHPTKEFCYPNGEKWETRPTVPGASVDDVRSTTGVPFHFPDHPSKHHWQVRLAFPPGWSSSAHGRQPISDWGNPGLNMRGTPGGM